MNAIHGSGNRNDSVGGEVVVVVVIVVVVLWWTVVVVVELTRYLAMRSTSSHDRVGNSTGVDQVHRFAKYIYDNSNGVDQVPRYASCPN